MDQGAPLVSVIIPAFNCAQWIGEAIDSVLNQTYKHTEIIVIDDGSVDNTIDLVKRNYGDFVILRSCKHQGPARTRNVGLGLSKGAYVQFLDADDVLKPYKFETQLAALQKHPERDVVYCPAQRFEGAKNLPSPAEHTLKQGRSNTWESLLSGNFIAIHAPLVRRRALERVGYFDPALDGCEDYDLWLRLARDKAFLYQDVVLCCYRRHAQSFSNSRRRQLRRTVATLRKVKTYAQLTPQEEAIVTQYVKCLRRSLLGTFLPLSERQKSVLLWHAKALLKG